MKKIFNFVIATTLITTVILAVSVCTFSMRYKENISHDRVAISYIINCANSYGEFYGYENNLVFNISDEYIMKLSVSDGELIAETIYVGNNTILDTQNICKCEDFSIKNIEEYIIVEIDNEVLYLKQKVGDCIW